jgi:hypothetical protein
VQNASGRNSLPSANMPPRLRALRVSTVRLLEDEGKLACHAGEYCISNTVFEVVIYLSRAHHKCSCPILDTQKEEEGSPRPYIALIVLISMSFQRCDSERPICQACIVAKKEELCFYEVVSVTRLLEENRAYKDKIRNLERALNLKGSTSENNAFLSSSPSPQPHSNASSSTSEVVVPSHTLASSPSVTGNSAYY